MPEEKNSSDNGRHSILLQAGNSLPPSWSDEQDESLNEIFRVLRKRKLIIIGCLVATVAIAALASILIAKKYKASVTVELNKDNSAFETSASSTLASALSGNNDLKTELQTASTILQSPSIAIAVIEKLNLRSSEDFHGKSKAAGTGQTVQNSELTPLDQMPGIRDPLVGRFTKNLNVEIIPDTRLLKITYTSRNPQQAALVANTIVEEYKKQYLHSHYASIQDASEWLTDQLSGLKEKVQSSEKRLADFQRQTGILGFDQLAAGTSAKGSIGGGFVNPTLEKFSALNLQLNTAEVNRVTKEAIYKLAQTQDANVVASLANSPLVLDGTSAVVVQGGGLTALATLQQQKNALSVEYADAVTKYGPKNPRLLDYTNRIAEVDVQINHELKNIAARARNDYELSRKVEDGIRKQFELQQQDANRVNDQATQFKILWQEAISNQALYTDLYTKLQEANVSAGVKASNITIADPARAPFAPVIPNIPFILAMGVGAGLFLGVSGAFLKENMDRSVVASSQVEAITRNVVLGIIPDFSKPASHRYGYYGYGQRKKREQQLVANTIFAANSSIAESFQSLRTSILLSKAGAPPKLISITSAIAGEGKTTVSTNLAAAFASHGSRVLLVDADLRRSRLARSMNMDRGVGLSNVLTGTIPFEDAVVEFPAISNLSLMLAGPRPPTPAELLGSERFTELLETASGQFDFVFVDTAPAVLVTDAVLISPKMDGTICVVRAGVTTRPLLYRVSELLRRSECHFLGFALNAVRTESADYYHYYGYHGNGDYYTDAET